MELLVPLDSQLPTPLYEQIYEYIKEEIRGRRLAAGTRLPSTRILAQNLKVSRSTTQMAYDQLLSEGYIESMPAGDTMCARAGSCWRCAVCSPAPLQKSGGKGAGITKWIFRPEESTWKASLLIPGGN